MNEKKTTQNYENISELFQGELDMSCLKTIFFYSCVAPIGSNYIGYYLNHSEKTLKEREIYKMQK